MFATKIKSNTNLWGIYQQILSEAPSMRVSIEQRSDEFQLVREFSCNVLTAHQSIQWKLHSCVDNLKNEIF